MSAILELPPPLTHNRTVHHPLVRPMSALPLKTIQAHCNKCGGERKHDVLHHETISWKIENEVETDNGEFVDCGMNGGTEYDMIRCCGCETIALREDKWHSESTDYRGRPDHDIQYYPPAVFRPEPHWLREFGKMCPGNLFIEELLKEIYVALHNNLRRLATMGIRALLEHVMIAKVGDKRTFQKNVQAFLDAGFISPTQRSLLDAVLEAGHATMHRAYEPTKDVLVTLMDIAEATIESAYLHEQRVQQLQGRIPPRKP